MSFSRGGSVSTNRSLRLKRTINANHYSSSLEFGAESLQELILAVGSCMKLNKQLVSKMESGCRLTVQKRRARIELAICEACHRYHSLTKCPVALYDLEFTRNYPRIDSTLKASWMDVGP